MRKVMQWVNLVIMVAVAPVSVSSATKILGSAVTNVKGMERAWSHNGIVLRTPSADLELFLMITFK